MVGGDAISDAARRTYDLARLERAVRALVAQHRRLGTENAAQRRAIEERDVRIRALEEQVLELNQRRQDVHKRIDDLISQIDHLDAQLERASG